MTITIRAARAADAEGMYQLWSDMRSHNAKIEPRLVTAPISREDFCDAIDAILGRPDAATFVADDEGQVFGFVRVTVEHNPPDRLPERFAMIGYLFIAPRHRRIGVGRQLMTAAAEWAAKQEGVHHLEMSVLSGDEQAAAFWSGLGFSPFIQRLWAPLPGSGA